MQPTILDFFKPTKKLIELGFSESEILSAVQKSGNDIESLTDKQGFENIPKWYGAFEILKEHHQFTKKVYMGEYEKEVKVWGYLVRIPGQYQGLKHGDILRQLFTDKWPWFSDFKTTVKRQVKSKIRRIEDVPEEMQSLPVSEILKMINEGEKINEQKTLWELYEFHGYEKQDYEMYLKTEHGTLYVPLQALLSNDFSIIEKRMNTYFSSYYNESGYGLNHRGRTKEQYNLDQAENRRKALLPLVSKEAEMLKSFISA